nr:uncharacterized protein LOC128677510 [Plodia interpunctella]
MKYIIILILLVHNTFGKENVVYNATGGDLFDLIRGIPPKDEVLNLTKVEGVDGDKLPDGIYFIPEDDALTPEDISVLHVHRKTELSRNIEQKPVSKADEKDIQ